MTFIYYYNYKLFINIYKYLKMMKKNYQHVKVNANHFGGDVMNTIDSSNN